MLTRHPKYFPQTDYTDTIDLILTHKDQINLFQFARLIRSIVSSKEEFTHTEFKKYLAKVIEESY
jgi:hypothetical protein